MSKKLPRVMLPKTPDRLVFDESLHEVNDRDLHRERVSQLGKKRSFFITHRVTDLQACRADARDPYPTNSPNHQVERRLLLHGSRPLGPADYAFSFHNSRSPTEHYQTIHKKRNAHVLC